MCVGSACLLCSFECLQSVGGVFTVCVYTHVTHFLLRHPSEDGVQLQVLSSCQQLVDGVKLRTVTHVSMHLVDLPQDAANTQTLA